MVLTIPEGSRAAMATFAQEHGFDTWREAALALIEAGLQDFPRWGVKRAVMIAARNEARLFWHTELLQALQGVEARFADMLANPPPMDMLSPELSPPEEGDSPP